jgi:hypothetical protein
MKIIISEAQHKRLFEEEQKVLHIPDIRIFGNDWDNLQRFLESKGNPPYSLGGNLDLVGLKVESLGNLVSVEHDLYAYDTPLKSLGSLTSVGGLLHLSNTPIKTLGNLTSVGWSLSLLKSKIESLGNLTYVGGNLDLLHTPISRKYSEEEIIQTINVNGVIYL